MIKQPQLFYFELSKVKPTKADGPEVMAWSVSREQWDIIKPHQAVEHRYSHWMQMPKAPSDQHEHAFLE